MKTIDEIFDQVSALESSIISSQLYAEYSEAKKKYDSDESLQEKILSFNRIKSELAAVYDSGDGKEKIGQLQTRIRELYSVIVCDPVMFEYNE